MWTKGIAPLRGHEAETARAPSQGQAEAGPGQFLGFEIVGGVRLEPDVFLQNYIETRGNLPLLMPEKDAFWNPAEALMRPVRYLTRPPRTCSGYGL